MAFFRRYCRNRNYVTGPGRVYEFFIRGHNAGESLMCGIIGYANADARNIAVPLLEGLSRLEYRGYDSAGIAVSGTDLTVYKHSGELEMLIERVPESGPSGAVGIGHTRWSTHGPPTDENAHPHTDCTDRVAVVHNGIIENARGLRRALEANGHTFDSQTDTEVIPHLIEAELDRSTAPETAFRNAVSQLEGSYAVGALIEGEAAIYATRHRSPLVLGLGDEWYYLASDVPAFLEYTNRVIYLEDGQVATIRPNALTVTNEDGSPTQPLAETVDWDTNAAKKGGYPHYMLKEIYDQPTAIEWCLRGRVGTPTDSVAIRSMEPLDRPEQIHFVSCGSSHHASLYGAQLLRERGIPAYAFLASEYDPGSIPIDDGTLVVAVTQSGETADTLYALSGAMEAGATTVAVTNVVGSTAARKADHTMYIRAGPEVGVAATKTFASQLVALSMFSSTLTDSWTPSLKQALCDLPGQIQQILDKSTMESIATDFLGSDAFFFIGRSYNAPVALEGALKTKEITYEHAEGFAAGELKHGPLSLVTDETPVIALWTAGADPAAMRTNIREVAARGAPVVVVTDSPGSAPEVADRIDVVPKTHPWTSPVLVNTSLQLFAYRIASALGRPIDKPRNLAKSVTVR